MRPLERRMGFNRGRDLDKLLASCIKIAESLRGNECQNTVVHPFGIGVILPGSNVLHQFKRFAVIMAEMAVGNAPEVTVCFRVAGVYKSLGRIEALNDRSGRSRCRIKSAKLLHHIEEDISIGILPYLRSYPDSGLNRNPYKGICLRIIDTRP